MGAALALPEWLPSSWTREDGVIEWATFTCYLVAGLLTTTAAWRLRNHRRWAVSVGILALLFLGVAGEEISWGQRLFDVETPEALVDSNRQDELNLHNLEGIQTKAVFGQLALAGGGLLLPLWFPGRWARVGVPFYAAYLAYRGGRVAVWLTDWPPAGDNAEAAELLLAGGVVLVATRFRHSLRRQLAEHQGHVGQDQGDGHGRRRLGSAAEERQRLLERFRQ